MCKEMLNFILSYDIIDVLYDINQHICCWILSYKPAIIVLTTIWPSLCVYPTILVRISSHHCVYIFPSLCVYLTIIVCISYHHCVYIFPSLCVYLTILIDKSLFLLSIWVRILGLGIMLILEFVWSPCTASYRRAEIDPISWIFSSHLSDFVLQFTCQY